MQTEEERGLFERGESALPWQALPAADGADAEIARNGEAALIALAGEWRSLRAGKAPPPQHSPESASRKIADFFAKGPGALDAEAAWRRALSENPREEDAAFEEMARRLEAASNADFDNGDLGGSKANASGAQKRGARGDDERLALIAAKRLKRLEAVGLADEARAIDWAACRPPEPSRALSDLFGPEAADGEAGPSLLALAEALEWLSLFLPGRPPSPQSPIRQEKGPLSDSSPEFWRESARWMAKQNASDAQWRGWALCARRARACASTLLGRTAAGAQGQIAAREWAHSLFFDLAPLELTDLAPPGLRAVEAELSPGAWERDGLEAFASLGGAANGWPRRGASARQRDASWELMQARGGAWEKIWARLCQNGWDGHAGKPKRAQTAPRAILGRLFLGGGWQWLRSVSPKPAVSLANWSAEDEDGELTAGEALGAVLRNPPRQGLAECIAQIDRLFPGEKHWPIAYEEGELQEQWQEKVAAQWAESFHDAQLGPSPFQRGLKSPTEPIEGLLGAWLRIADSAAFAGRAGGAWARVAIYFGAQMGEGFLSAAQRRFPEDWAAVAAKSEAGKLRMRSWQGRPWPLAKGSAREGLPWRASEWAFFCGLPQFARAMERAGAARAREEWLGAMARWCEKAHPETLAWVARAIAGFESARLGDALGEPGEGARENRDGDEGEAQSAGGKSAGGAARDARRL